ncbi:MAG: alpha/beta hydrolase [Actinomycetota bacterium]
MDFVRSADGTKIGFDRLGEGPPVILVSGGSVDRSSNAPVADLLAARFTVFNYDRRGRGPSGDTPPYSVQREVEDLDAVIAAARGSARVYGSSSGAALVLEAAASGIAIDRLALWEPPFILDPGKRPPADTARTFSTLVEAGRRDAAVEFFMSKVVGLPDEFVAQARSQPWWPATEALAHTLAYDAMIMGDYSVPVDRAGLVRAPTLVLTGGGSFPFMHETADALAEALPNGRTQVIEGQAHDIAADAIAPVLEEFFAG